MYNIFCFEININYIFYIIIYKLVLFNLFCYTLSLIFVVLLFMYKYYTNDTSPIKFYKIEYYNNLPETLFSFFFKRNFNNILLIIYKVIKKDKIKINFLSVIFLIFYIIFFILNISKKAIDFCIIFILVIFSFKVPRYYKLNYLLYKYSINQNNYIDLRIFIVNKTFILNGILKTMYYQCNFFVNYFKVGSIEGLTPKGYSKIHPFVECTTIGQKFTLTHHDIFKDDSYLLGYDSNNRKVFMYLINYTGNVKWDVVFEFTNFNKEQNVIYMLKYMMNRYNDYINNIGFWYVESFKDNKLFILKEKKRFPEFEKWLSDNIDNISINNDI